MSSQNPSRMPFPTATGAQDDGNGNSRYSPPPRQTQQPSHNRLASNGSSVQSQSASQVSQGQTSNLNGKMLLEGYRKDILNNFEGETPRYNPLNTNRTNSSVLLDTRDPIQIHLLVETALEDATEYEILSPEEVDALRKQCRRLTQRIEQTRQNLAVQSKYHEAAINMAKLYSPSSKDGKDGDGKKNRLSFGIKRHSHTEQIREADMERLASERKCEELSQELWGLEKRLIEPQTRLLKHTAGILQMTHKPPTKKANGTSSQEGIPGSPESMYTYSNTRGGGVVPEEDIFDERSLYRSFDRLDNLDGDADQTPRSANAPGGIGADAEAKLKELWEMMHPGEQDADSDTTAGPFSLEAFATKVQWLHGQVALLNDQKEVLQRQIKQQRELNNKSDETKDRELTETSERLKETQDILEKVEAQAQSLEKQLADALEHADRSQGEASAALRENIEQLQNEMEDMKASNAIDLAEMQSRLAGSDEKISDIEHAREKAEARIVELAADLEGAKAKAEARIVDLTADLEEAKAKAEARIVDLTTDLEEARSNLEGARTELEEARQSAQQARGNEDELDAKNMEIARLQTEVTIARAELDGAYGSRAQRAAEVASNPAIQREIDELKRELSETIEEYEVMTKASIEWERDREMLEKEIDKLRDEREGLEAKLGDEKVRWMGVKSPGGGGPGGGGPEGAGVGAGNTSTAVLKNEFKKMMRDTRAENAKALRAEQAERRRLEDELRTLKKSQGPGKSSLSQSTLGS